jgi:Sap, sulfolipid-1-addressing protein
MSGSWPLLFSQLFAPAMVVAVSPVSIIAAVILVLHTDRPAFNGIAFVCGRLIGLAAVTAVFVQAPRLLNGVHQMSSPCVLIVVGGLLLALGAWFWANRGRGTSEPRWLASLDRLTPVGAAAIGIFLVLSNPKMLAANAAAGLLIGHRRERRGLLLRRGQLDSDVAGTRVRGCPRPGRWSSRAA